MSDKQEFRQNEDESPLSKPTKKQKLARHCKRFWWLHLIIFCCITVLVVCLVIFVGVPNIAQDKVNESDLDIQSVAVFDTKPDSYKMSINSTLKTDGTVKADIDAFEGHMYLENTGADDPTPFATVRIPATNGDKNQDVNVTAQDVEIKDMDAFAQFNTWFTVNETVEITIRGDTKVQPKGLNRKSDVTFKKTLTVDALNLFNGTELTEGTLGKFDKDSNFKGKAKIPNRSHFTLDIGNVVFINYADNKNLGELYIDDLFLVPGDNPVDVLANLDQSEVLSIAQKKPYCETGVIPFQMEGKNVTNADGQPLHYFQEALSANNLTVDLEISLVLGEKLPCMDS